MRDAYFPRTTPFIFEKSYSGSISPGSGLAIGVVISFAFSSSSCTDDANYVATICMPNNQQATEIGNTSGDEANLVVGVHWIVTRNTVSIIEDSLRLMKGHTVFHEVDDCLLGIPIVFHLTDSTVELNS